MKLIKKLKVQLLSTAERKFLAIGLAGVCLAIIAGVGFYAATLPGIGTADSPLHLDYVWQVSQGDLPQFYEGPVAPFKNWKKDGVQFVSQHPPLYYAALAPAVGPLIDNGRVDLAVGVGRLITILMAVVTGLALAWGGWVFGGENKAIMAVAVPAIATSLLPFVKVGGDIMNDMPALLFTTLALIFSGLIIQHGPQRKLLIWLSVVCALGMASRASFISALGLSLLTVGVSVLLHGKGSFIKKAWEGTIKALLVLLPAVLAIGWFYWRNYQLSGEWSRTAPQDWVAAAQGRPYKSLADVLGLSTFWLALPQWLYGRPWRQLFSDTYNVWASSGVFISGLLLGGFRSLRFRFWSFDKSTLIIASLMIIQCLLVYGQQIAHATGYGAINPRYLLPLWLPLGLALAYGFTWFRQLRGQLVVLIAGAGWVAVVLNAMWFLDTRLPGFKATSAWDRLVDVTTKLNDLPTITIPLLLSLVISGLLMISISLYKLTTATVK